MKAPIPFERRKFAQIRALCQRWDCSLDRVYDLASKGVILLWHPEGKEGVRGKMVDVSSVLEAEKKGYLAQ